jgi:integrase
VREVIVIYQEERKKTVRPSTWDSDRWRLLKLDLAFAHLPIIELSEDVLREFSKSVKGDWTSIYKSLNTFFQWAKKQKYLIENPLLNIEHEPFGSNKEVYSVETFGRMLRIAAGQERPRKAKEPTLEFIGLLPWFLLSGFCGLRSCEAYRLNKEREALRWDDLRLDGEKRPYVEIRPEVAKSTRRPDDHRRIFSPLYIEALRGWLPLVPRMSPFVVPWTKRHMQNLKCEFTKATGIGFKENAFRNSFASYALAIENIEGIGHLAIEMGDSEAICKKHYVSSLQPLIGEQWFGLRPPTPPVNLIRMDQAA